MTIDTQKLAADIARVMELDAERTQGDDLPLCSEETAHDKAFIAAAPLMADIIRQQGELIEKLVKALREHHTRQLFMDGELPHLEQEAQELIIGLGEYSDSGVFERTEHALSLAAPLVKKAGEYDNNTHKLG